MVISDSMLIQSLGEMNEIRTMKVGDFCWRKDMLSNLITTVWSKLRIEDGSAVEATDQ